MLPSYSDILEVAGRPPLWWDGHGVPRFAPFHPRLLAVYDRFAVLVCVTCQDRYCGAEMLVGVGRPKVSADGGEVHTYTLDDVVAIAEAWGDPPRHNCPGAGETMVCESSTVVQAWEQVDFDWVRRTEIKRAASEPKS